MSMSEDLSSQLQDSISLSQDWSKKIDILEGALKSFKEKLVKVKHENKLLNGKILDMEVKCVKLQKEIEN